MRLAERARRIVVLEVVELGEAVEEGALSRRGAGISERDAPNLRGLGRRGQEARRGRRAGEAGRAGGLARRSSLWIWRAKASGPTCPTRQRDHLMNSISR